MTELALTDPDVLTGLCSPRTELSGSIAPGEQWIIRQALSLLDKCLREPGISFISSHAVSDWLRLQMTHLEREVFMVIYLDNQHRLLEKEVIALGTINSVEVHPREVVRGALRHNAAAVIVAHNHPSGYAEPSVADRHITETLKTVLELLDIRLLDHLVVGGADVVSFAERSWI
ncbi:TPA: DNA repair protein RadC [Citrobacter freundii]|uniref:RadC family protein n=1 Tax=Enterobacteriaceae TaxID=543 RepID=UPI000CFD5B7C|nr:MULTISPECIES: DNA repair protein RadC [Enterobacteriaceae]HBK9053096.1 DNA repair protein RadC [Escherichia coli]ELY5859197.1 DNA repair protein RadC [Cronobacter sakazakii]ELY5954466.1 DNA repair protein RadC [Cronobacter sakazakii]MDX7502253.1 DNA repair protein RadC [Citrobacter freundii]HAU5650639.1 DNA repair protein RadC [Citrobacter freundii]